MATVNRTVATLRIGGDSLDPATISRMLGKLPTSSQVKGQELESLGALGSRGIELSLDIYGELDDDDA
jgi:hypothetical protein